MTRWWAGLARLLSGGQQKAPGASAEPKASAAPPPPDESWERPVIASTDYPVALRTEIDDWRMPLWADEDVRAQLVEDQLRAETEAKTRRLRGAGDG